MMANPYLLLIEFIAKPKGSVMAKNMFPSAGIGVALVGALGDAHLTVAGTTPRVAISSNTSPFGSSPVVDSTHHHSPPSMNGRRVIDQRAPAGR
jgi:hypothetical protein